jgi:hypothetical protein
MPEYFFTVYAREKGAQAEQAATLSNDIAAFTYDGKELSCRRKYRPVGYL